MESGESVIISDVMATAQLGNKMQGCRVLLFAVCDFDCKPFGFLLFWDDGFTGAHAKLSFIYAHLSIVADWRDDLLLLTLLGVFICVLVQKVYTFVSSVMFCVDESATCELVACSLLLRCCFLLVARLLLLELDCGGGVRALASCWHQIFVRTPFFIFLAPLFTVLLYLNTV